MSLDFVAVDFETWNNNMDSMCQFGLVKVIDGKVVDSLCRIVRPLIVAGPSNKITVKKNGGIDEDAVGGSQRELRPDGAEADLLGVQSANPPL